jgi:hypothetical protein
MNPFRVIQTLRDRSIHPKLTSLAQTPLGKSLAQTSLGKSCEEELNQRTAQNSFPFMAPPCCRVEEREREKEENGTSESRPQVHTVHVSQYIKQVVARGNQCMG